MPAAAFRFGETWLGVLMADVMIGTGPHKGSHTAVAIGAGEEPLGELRVDACPSQAEQLLAQPGLLPAARSAAALVPGGVRREISAGRAARILEQVRPADAVTKARCELAGEFLGDIRRLDAQLRECNKKLAATVRASGTSLTGLFGVGPVIAGTVIGDVRHVFRFPRRDHFASWNGTAPVEVSSGDRRKVYRLSLRGNRRVNHAIHMAAISQIRHKHSGGRDFYEKKLAEG